MQEITVPAAVDQTGKVTDFVERQLETLGCSQRVIYQVDIAIDELFSNIARYAYRPGAGPATVRVDVEEDPLSVVITFMDHGVPYDPLAAPDPDTTLPAEKRPIGGLGVFMVRKYMDDVVYSYENGQNILSIKKRI